MSAESSRLYVVDNTVLSNYARIQRPDLLQLALASRGVTTVSVWQELAVGEARNAIPQCDWRWLPIVELTEAERELASLLQENVDTGESECLAVAISRAGIVVTDDRAARKQAEKRGIPMAGTVGVLKILVDDRRLAVEDAEKYLAAMIARGFYSPIQRFSQL